MQLCLASVVAMGVQAPTLKRLRGALRGTTYRRSRKETRGRKRKLARSAVFKMSAARKRLIKEADKQREVRWEDTRKASRAPRMHRSTLKLSFRREGIPVEASCPMRNSAMGDSIGGP